MAFSFDWFLTFTFTPLQATMTRFCFLFIHIFFFCLSIHKMKSANDKEVLSIEIYLHTFPVWFDKISRQKKTYIVVRYSALFFFKIIIYLVETFTHLAQLFWDFTSLRIEYPQCISAIYQFDGPLLIPFNRALFLPSFLVRLHREKFIGFFLFWIDECIEMSLRSSITLKKTASCWSKQIKRMLSIQFVFTIILFFFSYCW